MGMQFSLDQASIVGWLTRRDYPAPLGEAFPWDFEPFYWRHHRRHRHMHRHTPPQDGAWRAPRVQLGVLRAFLERLQQSVVTRYPEDGESLAFLVSLCRERMAALPEAIRQHDRGIVDSMSVARILSPLRAWFDVPFYFMPLGQQASMEQFQQAPDFTLWLQCSDARRDALTMDLLDPFPGLREVLSAKSFEPATICWNWSGETVILSAERAPVGALMGLVREADPGSIWSMLKERQDSHQGGFHLLQVSDLHFGKVSPATVTYVEQHLREKVEDVRSRGGVVQPIVTGDLMDTPSRTHLAEFQGFRNRMTDVAKARVVCIPGNHDMRRKGFLWRNWEVLSGLEWTNVFASQVCKVVFVCFDSSRDARLAQGKITAEQFVEVSTALTELRRLGDYREYLTVSLVHHHPFSTREDEVDTLPLPFLRLKEERFLRMVDGGHLVEWCGRQDIPLILHGHKHRPRFIGQEVPVDGRTRLVRAVGCGAAFGIEGKPLSYNWITWQPRTRTWTVSFFADPGDGSGFVEKRLAMGTLSAAE